MVNITIQTNQYEVRYLIYFGVNETGGKKKHKCTFPTSDNIVMTFPSQRSEDTSHTSYVGSTARAMLQCK